MLQMHIQARKVVGSHSLEGLNKRSLWRIQSGEVHSKKKLLSQQRNQVLSHQRKIPRAKHGEIERKKKVQQDMQKSIKRKTFRADCTD